MLEPFHQLRRRYKILFTLMVAVGVILLWKGVWDLAAVVYDDWLFKGNLVLSNIAAAITGILILLAAGVGIKRAA